MQRGNGSDGFLVACLSSAADLCLVSALPYGRASVRQYIIYLVSLSFYSVYGFLHLNEMSSMAAFAVAYRRYDLVRRLEEEEIPEEEQAYILRELDRRETEYMRLQRHKMSVEDFELLTIIGRGAFGEVSRLFCDRLWRELPLFSLFSCTTCSRSMWKEWRQQKQRGRGRLYVLFPAEGTARWSLLSTMKLYCMISLVFLHDGIGWCPAALPAWVL